MRRKTNSFQIGNTWIGSDHPVTIQSMTNSDTRNVSQTVSQINALATEGAEIVRVAVPDTAAADCLPAIIQQTSVPLVADIHFDYRLALAAIENGMHALRINPGNIGATWRVEEIIKAAKEKNIPIRIGVNSGSIDKKLLEKYGRPCAEAMVDSLLEHIEIFERNDFHNIVLSLKASNVPMMIEANRLIAEKTAYPLHLGVTEAGSPKRGTIKSAVGIGTLLAEGIGDTIRVSLTGDPLKEIGVAKEILKTLHLRDEGVEIISCPTCGRTEINLIELADAIEPLVKDIKLPLKIAVMGCVVNGPGEAREADLGIAGGKHFGLIFKNGEIIKRVEEARLLEEFKIELEKLVKEKTAL